MLRKLHSIDQNGCVVNSGVKVGHIDQGYRDEGQSCTCPFCEEMPEQAQPFGLVRGENDYTGEERIERHQLLAKQFNDPSDRDFHWILNSIKNPVPNMPQLHILVPETIFFVKGSATVIVSSSISKESAAVLTWDISTNIKHTNLRKLMSHAHLNMNPFPLDGKRNAFFKVKSSTSSAKKQLNAEEIDPKTLQEKLKSLGKREINSIKRFCETTKIDWISDFRVILRRVLEKNKCRSSEMPVEILNYKKFVELAETPLVRRVWSEVYFLQRFPKTFGKDVLWSRLRVDDSYIADEGLLKRASFEPLSVTISIITSSKDYVTSETERVFMNDLLAQDKEKFKLYTCYKVYQAILIFTRMRLGMFIAEFSEDMFGVPYLINISIFRAFNEEDLSPYTAWKVIRDRMAKAKAPLTISEEIKKLNSKLQEIDVRSKKLKEIRENNQNQRIFLVEDSPEEKKHNVDLLKNVMMGQFKRTVLRNMGEERMAVEEKFVRLRDSADEVFKNLQPKFQKKLSKIIYQPSIDYHSDFRKTFGSRTINSLSFGSKTVSKSLHSTEQKITLSRNLRQAPKQYIDNLSLKIIDEQNTEIEKKIENLDKVIPQRIPLRKSLWKVNQIKGQQPSVHERRRLMKKKEILDGLFDRISRSVDSRSSKARQPFEIKYQHQILSRSVDESHVEQPKFQGSGYALIHVNHPQASKSTDIDYKLTSFKIR